MSDWFNISGTCKSWIRVTRGSIQHVSIHVWHQQMDTISEFRRSWLGEEKNPMHHECRFHDMRNRDSIAAIESRLNLDRWSKSILGFRGSSVGDVKEYWHQESRNRDVWNTDWIWTVRSRCDLDRRPDSRQQTTSARNTWHNQVMTSVRLIQHFRHM